MPHLSGKTAIVTGASRGIGWAIARSLAREGAHCILCARNGDLLVQRVQEIEAGGGRAAALALDLRAPEAGVQLVQFALDQFHRLDILVNNAGATRRGEFADLTDEDWSDGFALKLFGAVRLTRAAWPYLTAAKGSVVNIAGIGGRTPGPQFAIGGSVNAALLSFTKSLAETGLRDDVQVNAINPGAVRTDRLRIRLERLAAERGISPSAAEELFLREEKVTRIGEPEDIAGLVSYLISPGARFLHGTFIDIDGGATKTL